MEQQEPLKQQLPKKRTMWLALLGIALVAVGCASNLCAVDMLVDGKIERSIVIVTASYNNKDWYEYNIGSLFLQRYTNYRVIYVDDCSDDGTGDLVEAYARDLGLADRITLIKNKTRLLAMENQYRAIHSCDNKDIILILDGDDWLAHDRVLEYLNAVYSDPNIWMTYGQFCEYPSGVRGFNEPIPNHVVRNNAFRQHYCAYSHARTFYAGLFKKIKQEDLMNDGAFITMCADIAVMLPMIEMACNHFKFIPEVLYVYNGENSINDHKISKSLQWSTDLLVRGRPTYNEIASPFN